MMNSSKWPLAQRLESLRQTPSEAHLSDRILDQFLEHVRESRLSLYPAQEEGILELFSDKNVILNTPTGSGKSLVATALHFYSVARGNRSIYTCPIKALVNEKFLALCRDFGPEKVGMITGDATVNPEADILCCTAEILCNDALRQGSQARINDVIMDEFHYYSDRERGVAWQIPLLTLPQTRFLLMSATLGETDFFEKELTRLNGRPTSVVSSAERPVPLTFEYFEIPLHETVAKLMAGGRTPIYLVSFTQRECAEEAQNFLSVDFCSKPEKKLISEALEGVQFSSPYGKEIQKLIKHGIGIHHAGLLPKYRVLVERLAQKGLLKLICGTDTLGVGVNVPIRTVLLTRLCKYDGEKTSLLSVRDFQQIAGRAGRKGFDNEGFVAIQAPEHVIENLRNEQKASADPKKAKKWVKRKPPEKGYVPWNRETFIKLTQGRAEALTSRFKITHSTLLNLLGRPDESGCTAVRNLIRESHESETAKKQHRKKAFQLFRSLVDRKIVELNPLRVNVALQEDFTLNHALSLYLLDSIQVLNPSDLNYALDLLTLVESVLENPDIILRRQLDQIKTEKMSEMKLAGMEYDERIEELEKLEYPKPNRDFIYHTFNIFSAAHPWVGQENIKPKSIAREMYETFQSFPEYIRNYGLERVEGLLLRYLSDVYKTLVQTVPDLAKTEEVEAIILYFRSVLRQIDSSLLDEWEMLKNSNFQPTALPSPETNLAGQSKKELTILIRNEVFRFVKFLANRDYEGALGQLNSPINWDRLKLEEKLQLYYSSDHSRICIDPKARHPQYMTVTSDAADQVWLIQQTLIDPEENNDWVIDFRLDRTHCSVDSPLPLELIAIKAL